MMSTECLHQSLLQIQQIILQKKKEQQQMKRTNF